MGSITGKTIIITGASSGIGAATALECAVAGMNLVLNARREDRLEEVAERARKIGAAVETVVGNVAETDTTKKLLDTAEEKFESFYSVFANAGYGMAVPSHEMSLDDVRQMFEVNFFASVDLVHQAANRLLEAKNPGHLLMCSSCLSKFSIPRHGIYAATKAAQNRVCSAMRMELKPHNIHVSSVHPITTMTEFFQVCAEKSGKENHKFADIPAHAPSMFVQPPERVAKAVVKCLRKPYPQVWTSHIVRAASAVFTFFPRFGDWAIMRQSHKD